MKWIILLGFCAIITVGIWFLSRWPVKLSEFLKPIPEKRISMIDEMVELLGSYFKKGEVNK